MRDYLTYYRSDADWSLIPPSYRDPIAAYVMDGEDPGMFLENIFSINYPIEFAFSEDFEKFFHCYVPLECKGSREKYDAWRRSGGLLGHKRMIKRLFNEA